MGSAGSWWWGTSLLYQGLAGSCPVKTTQQQVQGLPGSFLPSSHCHTSGCPNGTSGSLPLPLLPRLERKAKPTMRSHPSVSSSCHLSHHDSLGEGWAQPGELP